MRAFAIDAVAIASALGVGVRAGDHGDGLLRCRRFLVSMHAGRADFDWVGWLDSSLRGGRVGRIWRAIAAQVVRVAGWSTGSGVGWAASNTTTGGQLISAETL